MKCLFRHTLHVCIFCIYQQDEVGPGLKSVAAQEHESHHATAKQQQQVGEDQDYEARPVFSQEQVQDVRLGCVQQYPEP